MRFSSKSKLFASKKAQGIYEMVMLITGILLIVTVFIVVLSSRTSIPEPNLPTKTIILTERTFDIYKFAFDLFAKQSVIKANIAQEIGFSKCQKVSEVDLDNLLFDYILVTPDCVAPNVVDKYLEVVETEMNDNFGAQSYFSTTGFSSSVKSIAPSKYVLIQPGKEFLNNQFKANLVSNSDNSISVLIVSRRPLTVSATANFKDSGEAQWRFNAQRNLITQVPMPPSQQNVLKLTQNIGSIKSIAWLQIEPTINGKEANGESLTDADEEQFIADITAKLNGWVVLPALTPMSQLSANEYFAYIVLIQDDSLYVAFPNAKMAIQIHSFSK